MIQFQCGVPAPKSFTQLWFLVTVYWIKQIVTMFSSKFTRTHGTPWLVIEKKFHPYRPHWSFGYPILWFDNIVRKRERERACILRRCWSMLSYLFVLKIYNLQSLLNYYSYSTKKDILIIICTCRMMLSCFE